MKLYILSINNSTYGMFSEILVRAKDEEAAKQLHPCYDLPIKDTDCLEDIYKSKWDNPRWAKSFDTVSCKYIGEASPELTDDILMTDFIEE